MDRNLTKVRGIGWGMAAVVALGGTLVLGQWGDRLGSRRALSDDVVPYAFVDSIMVEAVLVLILAATLVVFMVVCRRWASRTTGLHPFWILGPGVVGAIGAAALVFDSQVVRYPAREVTLAEGRAPLDALLADLRDDGQGSHQPIPAGDDRLALDGPPELARLAASVEPVVTRCLDGVGRDTGAVRVSWSFARPVRFPDSVLAGRSPNGEILTLPADFGARFVGQAVTALEAAGFEVTRQFLPEAVDVSGARASPTPAKDHIVGDGGYSFTVAILPDPEPPPADPARASFRLQFEALSPCLRPE